MKIIDPKNKKPAPRGVIITRQSEAVAELRPVEERPAFPDFTATAGAIIAKVGNQFPRKTALITGSVMLGVIAVLVALLDVSESLRRSIKNNAVTIEWRNHDEDFIHDAVAFEGKISMRPLIVRERKRITQPEIEAPQVTQVAIRKRSPQHLATQVLRIINDANRRQTQAKRLAASIVSESIRQNYDPLFVAAVIKSESAFNEMAVSHKGASGLMQIMPATGKYLAEKNDVSWPTPAKLTDAGYNIHLGVSYLKQLERMYQGNRLLTLVAYNWGPGKLDRAIKTGRGVPAECYRYALKILKDHNLWENAESIQMS